MNVFALRTIEALDAVLRVDLGSCLKIHRTKFRTLAAIDALFRYLQRNKRVLIEKAVYRSEWADRPAKRSLDEEEQQ